MHTHVVILDRPMPGVRNTTFGFESENSAYEFQRKLDVGSRVEPLGQDYEIVPTIAEVFASLRAAADDLRQARRQTDLTTKNVLSNAIDDMIQTINDLGDYDEPLILSIKSVLPLTDLRGAEDHEAKTVEFLQHLADNDI